MITTPARFALNIPDGWIDYELDRQDFARQQAEMRAAATSSEERRAVDDLFRETRRLVRTARKQGAKSAAGLLARYDEGLLMAYVAVFALQVPDGEELSIADITAQLSRPAGPEGYGDRHVGSADLPEIGTVARVTGTEVVTLTEDVSAVMVAMHTIVPLPGQPGSYLVITGMSPNLPLADSLYDVFDAITGTFRFV